MTQHSDKFLTRFDNLPKVKQSNAVGNFTICVANYAKDKVAIQFESAGDLNSTTVGILKKGRCNKLQ